MDIEGGELIFLQENIEFIKNQINKITFEVHGHLMYGDSSPLSKNFNNECFKLLIDNNFVLKDKHSNTYHFEKIIIFLFCSFKIFIVIYIYIIV